MSPHFCKVGKIQPNLGKVLNLKELENMYLHFIEEAYNIMHSDTSLSDLLYHEATQLKKMIFNLKDSSANNVDAAF